MRPDALAFAFFISGMVSFNAGLWQVSRRYEKLRLLQQHTNVSKQPLKKLPIEGEEKLDDYLFRVIELEGTFDNEGTEIVGPRALPSYKGTTNSEESQGGYLILTPFQIANSDEFVFVNRGFVPIDAGKHRIFRSLYTGEGFTPAKIRGLIRKEEFLSTTSGIGVNELNFKPLMDGFSWMGMRPFDMAYYYYKRRWGADQVEERVKRHGAHHYLIETIEDFSGDDQRMVRGRAWPRRRDFDEMTYVSMPPIVHACYAAFWFFIAGGSVHGIRVSFRLARQITLDNKRRMADLVRAQKQRETNTEALRLAELEVQKIQQQGGTAAAAASAASNSGRKGSA